MITSDLRCENIQLFTKTINISDNFQFLKFIPLDTNIYLNVLVTSSLIKFGDMSDILIYQVLPYHISLAFDNLKQLKLFMRQNMIKTLLKIPTPRQMTRQKNKVRVELQTCVPIIFVSQAKPISSFSWWAELALFSCNPATCLPGLQILIQERQH